MKTSGVLGTVGICLGGFAVLFYFHQNASLSTRVGPHVINIGILLSLTGQVADMGAEGEKGFQLAIEELQSKWKSRDYEVRFVHQDSQSAPDLATAAINRLISGDHVDAVLGDVTSKTTLAAAPIAQGARIPLLSPSSTSERVTQVGDYIFTACYVDETQALAMAKYARKTLKAKTAAIILDMDLDHSREIAKAFSKEFERLGGQVAKKVSLGGNHDNSYVPQLTELRNTKVDVIYSPLYFFIQSIIFKESRTFQVHSHFLGTDAWDSPQLFKRSEGATEGAIMSSSFYYQNPSAEVQRFRKIFKEKYGTEPNAHSAWAYDSVFILERAISRIRWPLSGSIAKNIRDHLAETKNLEGVTGRITFDSDRRIVDPQIVILKLTKSGYTYLTRTTP